jgi:hypothetical protein
MRQGRSSYHLNWGIEGPGSAAMVVVVRDWEDAVLS